MANVGCEHFSNCSVRCPLDLFCSMSASQLREYESKWISGEYNIKYYPHGNEARIQASKSKP